MKQADYIQTLKELLRQYEDGAVLSCEVVNRAFIESNKAAETGWYKEEWRQIEETADAPIGDLARWPKRENEATLLYAERLKRNKRRLRAKRAIDRIVEDAPTISGVVLERFWESASGMSFQEEQ